MTVDAHLVALLGLTGMGPRRLTNLLAAYGDPARAWAIVSRGGVELDRVHLGGRVDRRAAVLTCWRHEASATAVDEVLDRHAALGVSITAPGDPWWPAAFVDDPEPPPVIFTIGDRSLLAVPSVAVIGTRRCTAAGASIARELGHDLAAAGVGVVSGLALGIDGAAHRGSLAAAGPTIGVVATGLDVVYPRRHASLWDAVGGEGVLVSESPLGTRAERWRFPARNRLIAGLARAVVVVESARTGGSMLTVDAAIERQTDVLAVPGPVRAPMSAGPNQLIVDGCGVVRDAADIFAAVGLRGPASTVVPSDRAAADGDRPGIEHDDPVAHAVSWPASSLDEIVAATGLSFTDVATRLSALELAGVVERVPQGFQRRSRP